ncbi:MAG: hypothetical protein IJF33_01345 [Clostridia bacterium]|nr:hypothetical protein [Clostridia bacterium]
MGNKKSFHRIKLNDNAIVDSILSVLFLIVGVVLIGAGFSENMAVLGVIGLAVTLGALVFFVHAIRFSVFLERDGIRIRRFLREQFYVYTDFESYRTNRNYMTLYLDNGRRIRFKSENCDLDALALLQKRLRVRGNSKKHAKASGSRLYWGNCSRPVQITLFCLFTALVSLIGVGCLVVGSIETSKQDLTTRVLEVVEIELDSELEDVILIAEDGTEYVVEASMTSYLGSLEQWKGTELRIWYDDFNNVCELRHRYGDQPIYTLEQYNADMRLINIAASVFFGLLALVHPIVLPMILLAYRDPDKHPKLYEHWETDSLWTRH